MFLLFVFFPTVFIIIFKGKVSEKKLLIVLVSLFLLVLISSLFIWKKLDLSFFQSIVPWILPNPFLVPYFYSSIIVTFSLYFFSALLLWGFTHFCVFFKFSWKKIIYILFNSLLIFISALFYFSSKWTMSYFGNIHFDQIMYTLSQPIEGGSSVQITDYIKGSLLNASFITIWLVVIMGLIIFSENRSKQRNIFLEFKIPIISIFTILGIIITSFLSINMLGYKDVKAYFFDKTKIYEKYYVSPEDTLIQFNGEKRNLIYIFLESMESSYSSKEYGGAESNNLIPNLTNLALKEGVSFSNSSNLGGMISIPGANQTVSSMFAQTSGLPLRTSGSLDVNDYGGEGSEFMPGAYTLGQILEKEGYNQMLYIGSPASFGGRDKYFMQHGDYEIRDYYWIQGQGLIPNGYSVWWGVEDEKLFPFAKQSILELANKNEPFNFTLLTTDTHFEDGYASESTPNLFNDQYSNVIHYSDEQVYNFISWIKEQSFYDNTTIILVGDHPTMDKDFFENIDPNYQRTVYNVILNSPTKVENSINNRIFNATDMFPTTLAALGAKIDGNRLGLGTNLYSSRKTLMEELGKNNYIDEIAKKSDFYNKKIIKGTDYQVEFNNGK
ncbi:LTA synthase family protein [Enterococcus italicus]